MANFRQIVNEQDFSGTPQLQTSEYGGCAIPSMKGSINKPILIKTSRDITDRLGEINSTYWQLLEVNSYRRIAPIWVSRIIGLNYLYAGVHVSTDSVYGFGSRAGLVESSLNYTVLQTNTVESFGTGDGINDNFTGTLTNTPITSTSLQLKRSGTLAGTIAATESGGTITGADISAGTLNLGTGAIDVTLTGTPGTPATYTTDVDLVASPIDLTLLVKPLAFNLNIDGTLYENIQTGLVDSSFTSTDLQTLINTAVGTAVASASGNFTQIDGLIGDATNGLVQFLPPTDLVTYDNGLAQLILSTYTSGNITGTASTNPSGAILKNGETITADYLYTSDESLNISHSIFAESPFNDSEYTMYLDVEYLGGYQYTVGVYELSGTTYSLLKSYTYSLIEEKDATGRSLYYEDVFKNTPFIFVHKNTAYVDTPTLTTATKVQMTGGYAGDAITSAEEVAAWTPFQKKTTYKVNTFLDIDGTQYLNAKNIIDTYQTRANLITTPPLGNDSAAQITYRQGTALNTDKVSMICGWRLVKNPFTGRNVWTSSVGAVGANYARMEPYFDALAPAGIPARGIPAGLIDDPYQIIELENEYDDAELLSLNNVQLNPIVFNETYGYYLRGDNTLKSVASDTSRIKNRRLYDLMLDNTVEIMLVQEFKNNDTSSQQIVKLQLENKFNQILARGYLNDLLIVCDDTNNTAEVKNNEQFVVDIYVQATAESQVIQLNFIRVDQTTVLSNLIQ